MLPASCLPSRLRKEEKKNTSSSSSPSSFSFSSCSACGGDRSYCWSTMEKCHDRTSSRDNTATPASSSSGGKGKEMWMSCCKQYGRSGAPALGCSNGGGGGFSWLQRSYSCSFCKREFRSAQALGGHMNVHRRDKARLRASPPLDLGPSPLNPNPNLPPSPPLPPPASSSASLSSSFYPIPNLNLPPPPPNATAAEDCNAPPGAPAAAVVSKHPSKAIYPASSAGAHSKAAERGSKHLPADAMSECMDLDEEETAEESALKRGKLVNLNLEIGFFGDHGDHHHGLDLELRLGYTN